MKISHIALAVRPEEYEDVKEKFIRILGDRYEEKSLENQKIKVLLFKLDNCSIEIITPTDEGSSIDGFLRKKGNGIHHFALKVDDVREETERLKREGFVFSVENDRGAKGGYISFIHPKSTGGFLIELVEDEY